MLFASLASGVLVLIDRGLALHLGWPVLAAPAAAALLAFIVPPLLRREPLTDAAIELDSNLGLADRIATGVAFEGLDDAGPFETLARRDAEAAAESARVRDGVPVRLTAAYRWWPLTTAGVLALAIWLPSLAPRSDGPRVETAAERQERETAREQINKAMDDARMALEEQPELYSDQTRRDLEALQRLQEELTKPSSDPEDAKAKAAEALSDAANRLQDEAAAESEALDATTERFKKGAGSEDALGEALAEGDFERALDELQAIERSLESATQEEREAIAERLREVAENIDDSAGPEPPSAEERLREEGLDPALADEIANQPTPEAMRESLEEQGADPLEAQRIAEQIEQDRQTREAQEQSQRNAQEFRESLEQAAGECENPGQEDGGENSGENAQQSGGSEGEEPSEGGGQPQGQPQPGQGQQPQSGQQPGGSRPNEQPGSGMREAQRIAQEMSQRRESAGRRQSVAEQMREEASGLNNPPTPAGGAGGEDKGLAGASPRTSAPPPPNTSLRTDNVDAREGAESNRVRGEVEAQGPALPERRASSGEAGRTLREAAPSAERAIESQGVPARYRDAVRRYFRQQRERESAPALAPDQDGSS